MVREESRDLVAVLLRQHRAGGVDEPAAGLDQRGGGRQQRPLLLLALRQVGGPQPPLGVRPPAPGARAGAGGVDEHQVEAGAERGERGLVAGLQHLRVAHAGPLQPLEDRPQPLGVAVIGVDLAGVAHGGSESQRLAAGACTNIEHLLARTRACHQCGDLRALVLHLVPAAAVPESRPRRWVAGPARPEPAAALRSATAASGMGEKRASAFSTFSRSAFSVLTRRSTGARRASAAPSSAAAAPKARANDGSSQSG